LENPNPVESLFRRYLENKCTPDEVASLLGHFRAGTDEAQLRKLISEQLDADHADDARHSQAVHEVYASLARRITGGVRPVDGGPAPAQRNALRLLMTPYLRNAAVWLLILCSAGAALYLFKHREKETLHIAMLRAAAGAGERKEIVLPDSSHVWLNAGTSIDYPRIFEGNERNVSLAGEAFFEVMRDPAHPFVIRTGALHTRVVGTSFNIRAYPDDPSIAVSVVTGRVKVSSAKTSVDLLPDQQAVYGKSDYKLVAQAYPNAHAIAAWKEGKLQFRNRPLQEVIRTLERRYAVAIRVSESAKECPVLHADFDDTEPVGRILEMLAVSLNGKVEMEGETGYQLVTPGCF